MLKNKTSTICLQSQIFTSEAHNISISPHIYLVCSETSIGRTARDHKK